MMMLLLSVSAVMIIPWHLLAPYFFKLVVRNLILYLKKNLFVVVMPILGAMMIIPYSQSGMM